MIIRTITAAASLRRAGDLSALELTARFLGRTRERFSAAGHHVQSVRAATPPLVDYAPDWTAEVSVASILALDRLAAAEELYLSLGPVAVSDGQHERFASWAAEIIRLTRQTNLSVRVASQDHGFHRRSARAAAEAIAEIARVGEDGEGNFRFAAAALVPAGTPFFPVAWSAEAGTFSLGLENAGLLQEVFAATDDRQEAVRDLRRRLNDELAPLEELARRIAADSGWRYLGLDASPAPSPAASIAQAIESLTGAPFGSPSTLAGCAAITDVLHSLDVATCGYSGLMLPLLEDEVLAQRAREGRYGTSDLLLYSSVCGTGLDTVPLPGDTGVEVLAGLVEDVAALAVRYRKPLAARLLPIPGREAGDPIRIDNPRLIEGVVMDPAS